MMSTSVLFSCDSGNLTRFFNGLSGNVQGSLSHLRLSRSIRGLNGTFDRSPPPQVAAARRRFAVALVGTIARA